MPFAMPFLNIFVIFMAGIGVEGVCIPDTTTVQSKFCPQKFAGKWYETAWLMYPWSLNIGYFKKTKVFHYMKNGDYLLEIIGRKHFYRPGPCSGENHTFVNTCPGVDGCHYNYGTYKTPSNCKPGRYLQTVAPWTSENPIRIQSPVAVYETDYCNYALMYGCIIHNADGSCALPNCWILSKKQVIPAKYLKRIDYILENKLCLNRSEFYFSLRGSYCPYHGDQTILHPKEDAYNGAEKKYLVKKGKSVKLNI